MSGKYALIIANTEYIDPKLAELTAPGKDAEDFARILQDKDICAFDDVKALINQQYHIIRETIDEFFDQKKPDDLLVLYFSGHGVRDEFGTLYLTAKNTNRARLRSTAIKSDFVHDAMDQSRSKRQVLILDCCNSGAFPQGTKAEVGGAMGMTRAFQGYGRFVLTASDATQFAWEGDKVIGETDNSLFTHYLVEGLEGKADRDGDGQITVDELYDYAYEQVKLATPKQTPSKFSSKQQGEIILRQNIRIEDTRPIPLPDELTMAMENPFPSVREGAVRQLEALLGGRNLGLARSARLELERVAKEDDSRHVSKIAADILERIQDEENLAAEETARERAEKEAKKKAELEAAEKAAREETERKAAEKAAKEKAELEAVEKAAREKAEKEAKEKADREAAEKTAKEKAEREVAEKAAREKEERERLEREEKARKEKEAGELHYKGMLAQKEGKFDEAERLFRQSLEIAIDLKDEQGKANILHQLTILTQDRLAKEKAEREAAEKVAKEKAEREAVEKATQEKMDSRPTETVATSRGFGEDKKSDVTSKLPPKPNSFPEEIKSSKPTSPPEAMKSRGKPKNLPK